MKAIQSMYVMLPRKSEFIVCPSGGHFINNQQKLEGVQWSLCYVGWTECHFQRNERTKWKYTPWLTCTMKVLWWACKHCEHSQQTQVATLHSQVHIVQDDDAPSSPPTHSHHTNINSIFCKVMQWPILYQETSSQGSWNNHMVEFTGMNFLTSA
jgi:hypothetical protein